MSVCKHDNKNKLSHYMFKRVLLYRFGRYYLSSLFFKAAISNSFFRVHIRTYTRTDTNILTQAHRYRYKHKYMYCMIFHLAGTHIL